MKTRHFYLAVHYKLPLQTFILSVLNSLWISLFVEEGLETMKVQVRRKNGQKYLSSGFSFSFSDAAVVAGGGLSLGASGAEEQAAAVVDLKKKKKRGSDIQIMNTYGSEQ